LWHVRARFEMCRPSSSRLVEHLACSDVSRPDSRLRPSPAQGYRFPHLLRSRQSLPSVILTGLAVAPVQGAPLSRLLVRSAVHRRARHRNFASMLRCDPFRFAHSSAVHRRRREERLYACRSTARLARSLRRHIAQRCPDRNASCPSRTFWQGWIPPLLLCQSPNLPRLPPYHRHQRQPEW